MRRWCDDMSTPATRGSALVLLVEDEPLVRELVALNLRHSGYEVVTASSILEAQAQLTGSGSSFVLGVFDVMLPDGDGFSLVQRARASGLAFPILMLTARGDTQSKVRGLDAGADDYLTKPFDVPELLARVRALLRRTQGSSRPLGQQARIANHTIQLDTGLASTNEGELLLTERELALVKLFIDREGLPLSRADILEEVWGMDSFPTDRTVDNFIVRLRKLFEPDVNNPVHFLTLRGRGYLFRA